VKVRLVRCRRETVVESLRIFDSHKAISNKRVVALDFAVQIKRADALLEEFDHLLFDALVDAGKRRYQINMVRIPKVCGS
jgi:hypothetical protein